LMRFETIVDRTEFAFSQALGEIGLRICKIPGLRPEGLKSDDIGEHYACTVKLRAEDPIGRDRSVTLGKVLMDSGLIDLHTFLVEHYGKTDDEAEEIEARLLVDNATRNNPIIAQMMGMQVAKEAGMEEEYNAIKMAGEEIEKPMQGLPQTGSEGGPPRRGNIKTERGMQEADMSLTQGGARSAPS